MIYRARPRLEGDREKQILQAALDLVAEQGYDRLTLDAVAARAHASKATLYRRWSSKAELIVDGMSQLDQLDQGEVDTGDLLGDLYVMAEHKGGMFDPARATLVIGLITAMHRDADLAAAFRSRFLDPRLCGLRATLARARARGEIAEDVDLDLLGSVMPALFLYHLMILGSREPPHSLAEKIIQQIVLPAARGCR